MNLKNWFLSNKFKLIIVISITLLSMLISVILSFFIIKPEYKTGISIMIEKNTISEDDFLASYNDNVELYKNIASNYAYIIKSRRLAENVINKLNLNMSIQDFQKNISVTQNKEAPLLTITIKNNNAKQCFNITTQFISSLKEVGSEILGDDYIKILDEPEPPIKTFNPSIFISLSLGLLVGSILSIILIKIFKISY